MKKLYLFPLGAGGYCLLEILWRGYTHWAMAIDGGICLLLIGIINEHFLITRIKKSILCALSITVVELISGMLLNILLKWNVWDYSDRFLNLYGQICPLYTALWVGLSYIILYIMDTAHAKRKKTI